MHTLTSFRVSAHAARSAQYMHTVARTFTMPHSICGLFSCLFLVSDFSHNVILRMFDIRVAGIPACYRACLSCGSLLRALRITLLTLFPVSFFSVFTRTRCVSSSMCGVAGRAHLFLSMIIRRRQSRAHARAVTCAVLCVAACCAAHAAQCTCRCHYKTHLFLFARMILFWRVHIRVHILSYLHDACFAMSCCILPHSLLYRTYAASALSRASLRCCDIPARYGATMRDARARIAWWRYRCDVMVTVHCARATPGTADAGGIAREPHCLRRRYASISPVDSLVVTHSGEEKVCCVPAGRRTFLYAARARASHSLATLFRRCRARARFAHLPPAGAMARA